MSKIIREEYITGEKGVAEFNSFCANHSPFLIFREEAKHDFGIDGEIELTRRTENGKIEATASVLKIQLKSTKTESYINKNTEDSFEFVAKTNDIEYWNKHDLPVVIIVFFVKTKELYAKIVDKNLVLKRNKKSHKILFDKTKNKLIKDVSNIEDVLEQKFVPRINNDVGERLFSNLMKVNLPKYIYEYESNFKQVKKIFNIVNELKLPFPHFVLISDKLHSFSDFDDIPDSLYNQIFKEGKPKRTLVSEYSVNLDNRRYLVRLTNSYLKNFFYHQKMIYNKDLYRYYFDKLNEEPIETKVKENSRAEIYRKVNYRGRANNTTRSLVTKYTYYEESFFFKHLGFQTHFHWLENDLYLTLEPKYYYSIDGVAPLDNPKRITRLTNQLKSNERNQQFLNHLFFYRNYFGKQQWILRNFETKIEISRMVFFDVDFGISRRSNVKTMSGNNNDTQLNLDL